MASLLCTPPPSSVFVLSPHCPDCGLPERPAAVVHADPRPLLFPSLFCTAPRPTSSYCRAEVAARAACDISGVLVPHAIPVSSVTGPGSCFSSAVHPVQPPPATAVARWLTDPPAPPPRPLSCIATIWEASRPRVQPLRTTSSPWTSGTVCTRKPGGVRPFDGAFLVNTVMSSVARKV